MSKAKSSWVRRLAALLIRGERVVAEVRVEVPDYEEHPSFDRGTRALVEPEPLQNEVDRALGRSPFRWIWVELRSAPLLHRHTYDSGQFWEFFVEVLVAPRLRHCCVGAWAPGWPVPVFGVKGIDDIHALHHLTDG